MARYKSLSEYLIELSEDKKSRDLYIADKKTAVAKSQMSPKDKKILLGGNLRQIQRILREEDATAVTATTYMVSHVVSAGT
jgi:hypothetical protein